MRIQRTLAATLSGALLATGIASLATPVAADVDNYNRGCGYFEAGNGSAADPYQIADGYDLEAITYAECYDEYSNFVGYAYEVGAYFVQTADIDLSEWDNWSPIGGVYNPWQEEYQHIDGDYIEGGYFDGNYDGQNFAISNVKIEDDAFEHRSGYGIFGHTYYATIENMNIEVYVDVESYFDDNISDEYFFTPGSVDGYGRYDDDVKSNNGYEGFTGWIDWDETTTNNWDSVNEYYYDVYDIDTCWFASDIGSLVGYSEDSTIRNINAEVEVRGANNVGGLVGQSDSDYDGTQIVNASVTGYVDADDACGFENIGGLVGEADDETSVVNSDAATDVTADYTDGFVSDRYEIDYVDFNEWRYYDIQGDSVGGLIGQLEDANVINSSASGTVRTHEVENVGGLVGFSNQGSIVDSSASGDVTSVTGGEDIGGLVGDISSDEGDAMAVIQNSFATGDVTAVDGDYVGGLVGYAEDEYDYEYTAVSIIDSYATGNVTAADEVGGLLGEGNVRAIINSYATGTVNGDDNVGGLVGYLAEESSITSSYATGAVAGNEQVGGLVGNMEGDGAISKSYATGDVTVAELYYEGSESFGGLVGQIDYDVIVDKSYATGDVDVTGAYAESQGIGGLVGWVLNDVTIRASYATGDVTGLHYSPQGASLGVGGFVGIVGEYEGDEWASVMIKNSYSTGAVSGAEVVGGFIGGIDSLPESVELVNNYTASSVDGDAYTDLFANVWFGYYSQYPWAVTNMFVSEVKVGSSASAVAVKEADIKKAATLQAKGWQISDSGHWSTKTWSICSKVNEGLPYLSWQTTSDLCVCEGVVIPAVKFTTGSSTLDADDLAAITAAAQTIKDGKCKNVALVGFTNTVKSNTKAKALADARSSAVRVALKAALWEVGHPVKFTVSRDTLNTTQTRWNKVTITAAE